MDFSWGNGAFWMALRVALGGVLLLLLMRPLLVKRFPRLGGKHAPRPGSLGKDSHAPAGEEALSKDRERAQAAYDLQAKLEAGLEESSPIAELPITPVGETIVTVCPPELRRRIDRIEAKVRARRAGSRG